MKTIYLVPHTHYDVAWAFTKEDSIHIMELMFKRVMELLHKTTDYKFIIEQVYLLKEIEKSMGRRFSSAGIYRPLDIDVAAAEIRVKSDLISIPHPGLSARRFMLLPLCELDPGFPGGEGGETFRELLDRCRDASEVVRI